MYKLTSGIQKLYQIFYAENRSIILRGGLGI